MRLTPGNAQHKGRRSSQQDAFGFSRLDRGCFESHHGFLAVLADGMGGLESGKEAGRLAVKAFLGSYAEKPPDRSIPEALLDALDSANRAVLTEAEGRGQAEMMGTTLVAAVLQRDGLFWVSVGDSGLFLLRDDALIRVNLEHTYAERLDDRADIGEITPKEALTDPQRDALTSFVGLASLKEIDGNPRPFPLRAGDRILLSSDGLFKTLQIERIAEIFLGRAPAEAADALVTEALSRNESFQDNVTVLTIALDPTSEATSQTPAAPWRDSASRTTAVEVQPPAAPSRNRLRFTLSAATLVGLVGLALIVRFGGFGAIDTNLPMSPIADVPLATPRAGNAEGEPIPDATKGDEGVSTEEATPPIVGGEDAESGPGSEKSPSAPVDAKPAPQDPPQSPPPPKKEPPASEGGDRERRPM